MWAWTFTDNSAFKTSATPPAFLYFPLCSTSGLKSCVTPYLRGDSKIDQNSFLLQPQTRWDIQTSLISRKIFIKTKGKVLKGHNLPPLPGNEKIQVQAGLLWHKVLKTFKKEKLALETLNFATLNDNAEIMKVTVKNTSSRKQKLDFCLAVPVYARSADNIRDHHHVTGLLNRIYKYPQGIIVKPTMLFDEKGHHKNESSYFVWAYGTGKPKVYATLDEFTGKGTLDDPQVLTENIPPSREKSLEGKEAVAAFLFSKISLNPGEQKEFYLVMGIGKGNDSLRIRNKYKTRETIYAEHEKIEKYWKQKADTVHFYTGNDHYDNWARWVRIQPVLRNIYGNSFLPDFDYGKGGRGWRDLWQDCLTLLFIEPRQTRDLLLHNFKGVRIDGTNATIIDYKGNFKADRNNIPRVWSDHGCWPFFTTKLYIDLTGDYAILFKKVPFWKDHLTWRCRETDTSWEGKDNSLKTTEGKPHTASVFEHLLVQNLVQFFNCGPHGYTKLENADWNDGLDMASIHGETVTFTCFYAWNILQLKLMLEKIKNRVKTLELSRETIILLDTLGNSINYNNVKSRQKLLQKYLKTTTHSVSGKTVKIKTSALIKDLERKSNFLYTLVRKKEWINSGNTSGLFNGYYDNNKKKVAGKIKNTLRMTLTGQAFPVMTEVATLEQTDKIWKSVKKHLYDNKLKGFRLNTNFRELKLDLGRAFGFSYGDKENGAFFSHMNIMFAYSLYSRGLVKEGFEVLNSLYKMSVNTEKSLIYPCLPEYFNLQGQGLYSYLTGSASWYVFTVITQMFGIRGEQGHIVVQPKLLKENFKFSGELRCKVNLQNKDMEFIFKNPHHKGYPYCKITGMKINGKKVTEKLYAGLRGAIPKTTIKRLPSRNRIEITLG